LWYACFIGYLRRITTVRSRPVSVAVVLSVDRDLHGFYLWLLYIALTVSPAQMAPTELFPEPPAA
jgi:hypothetical protein